MSTTYVAAASVPEALEALAGDPDAHVVAGGTDLVVGTRNGKREMPASLVAIHRLEELDGVDVDAEGGLTLGALVNHATLERSPVVRERWTAISDGSALIGSPATRHVGTLGGNLANGSPAMDTGAPLAVLGASVTLRSLGGERTLAIDDLFVGPGRTALERGELLTAVTVPAPGARAGSAYVRLEYRRSMEIAVIGAAALVELDDVGAVRCVRVALSAVAPTIVRAAAVEEALAGADPTPAALAAAAALATEAAVPISDLRASREYRLALIPTIARRALAAAVDRARGRDVPVPATRYAAEGSR
ncbi:MAG: xanthine dehydrogenase FAD-binding subunit [Solirubrobacteraceae bacterium]|nr:xanthine dehydrogenase FAD-binding subunit [Solirubrobacteraceae bacterium]